MPNLLFVKACRDGKLSALSRPACLVVFGG